MRRIMFFLGAVIVAATITFVGAAVLNNTFVWNNTFDVTQPNILCNINVGEYRIVDIPVSINVSLGYRKLFSAMTLKATTQVRFHILNGL